MSSLAQLHPGEQQSWRVLLLSEHLHSVFASEADPFSAIMRLDGESFRDHKHRRTIRVVLGGRPYFVKLHDHAGLPEILRNVREAKRPILTAEPEFRAIRRLEELGVPTMTIAGYGIRGTNPARLQSFLITDELVGMESLENLVIDWRSLPAPQQRLLRIAAIKAMAGIARELHGHGLCHRDFYLCHFLTPDRDWAAWSPRDGMELHLIDLHRVAIRDRTPRRALVKDLAGLLFSALDETVTARDLMRFWKRYRGECWKTSWPADAPLRGAIIRRALRQYRSKHGRRPPREDAIASFA